MNYKLFAFNNCNKVLFLPVTLFSNENTPDLKLALSHVPRTQIRGPSISDRDPLAKLLKLLLNFVTINTHIFERSGLERFKN